MAIFRWVTPNQLTTGRILAVPVVLVLAYLDRPLSNYVATVVFGLACLTDYWDGVLARQRDEVTHLGRLLDPIADKMLIISALILLVWMGIAGVIPTILITLREFAVGGLRSVAAVEGIVISASRGAKWKTVLQMAAVGVLLLHHDPLGIPLEAAGQWVLWLAAVWSLWTGFVYFREYFRGSREAPTA